MELHLPLSCTDSSDANIPMICLSSTSDDAGVVAMSSLELFDPILALLDGKSIGVTSVLLTSTGSSGS